MANHYRKNHPTILQRVFTLIERHFPNMVTTAEIKAFLNISTDRAVKKATTMLVREGKVKRLYKGAFILDKSYVDTVYPEVEVDRF